MLARKLAPALAAGCALVSKPAAETPLSAVALAELCYRAGLPSGLFNVITTTNSKEVGLELCTNPKLRKLTFTGSTNVGRILMRQCSDQIKKITLELGGNAPFIVFSDADIDAAVEGAMLAKYRNAGQTCVCVNRFYVEEDVYDEFSQKLAAKVKQLKVGNGSESGITIGPLIDEKAVAKVQAHITDAVYKGATMLNTVLNDFTKGTYFEPAVLINVTNTMRIAREEAFGPIAPIFKFTSIEDVIRQANDTEFGLASYFYAKDLSKVWRLIEELEYGMVGVNTGFISSEVAPFGGIKQSGQGREGSKYGLDDYLEIKYACQLPVLSYSKSLNSMPNMNSLSNFISLQRSSSQEEKLPLSGVRVLDLSTVIAAPFAAAMLGDAGAEVIKVENPNVPDALRSWGTCEETGIEPYHAVIGRNKLPVTINLKSDAGKETFIDLIKNSDILIENMRVGAIDRFGLSHEALQKINPGLIIGKISGYGMTGSHAKQPGFGTLAEAYSGFTHLNGNAKEGPASPPMALANMTAGIHLAYAVSLALHHQKRNASGGQLIDISLYEPLFGFLAGEFVGYKLSGINPQPFGNELRSAAPRNIFRTKDRRWIALSCSSQGTWKQLAKIMGHEHLIRDPRFLTNNDRIKRPHREALNKVIQTWLNEITEDEALHVFHQDGITAGPIKTMACIDNDPHCEERGTFTTVTDPVNGIEIKMPDVPFRMSGQPARIKFPGLPHVCANRTIFKDLLGYSDDKLSSLGRMGAI